MTIEDRILNAAVCATAVEIAERVGVHSDTVRRHLKALEAQGRVRRAGTSAGANNMQEQRWHRVPVHAVDDQSLTVIGELTATDTLLPYAPVAVDGMDLRDLIAHTLRSNGHNDYGRVRVHIERLPE